MTGPGKSKKRFDSMTPQQEAAIVHFLYDEGPQKRTAIMQHLGVGEERAGIILNGLLEAGVIEKEKMGDSSEWHWLITEPAEEHLNAYPL